MADVTIVAEDAERLVRDGGLVNRNEGPPDDLPEWFACVECDHRTRQTNPHLTPNAHYAHFPSGFGGQWHDVEPDGQFPFAATVRSNAVCVYPDPDTPSHPQFSRTVTVVDVHHAETCARRVGRVIADVAYCHPDAKGGRWHWTVEASYE